MEVPNISESGINLPEKVQRYESFVNDVLKEQLRKTHEELDRINCEIAEYIQLKCFIESAMKMDLDKDGIKTQVDIGCNFYVEAKLDDAGTVFVAVGLGYYVEYPLLEAVKVIDKRVELLEKRAGIHKKQSATTKGHIKLVLLGLQELQALK